jgi:hypothetical protein
MKQSHLWQKCVFSVASLLVVMLLAACAAVGTNGTGTSITGTLTNVNASGHAITLTVGNQTYTVNGLSDQEIAALQSQVGKTYVIQVTQNSDGSYSLTAGTNPTPGAASTPGANETPEGTSTPEAGGTSTATSGSIAFTGSVQSASSSSLTATMPDGSALTMAINAQTDQAGLNGVQLQSGQKVKIESQFSGSGFVASKIKLADAGDLADASSVDFQGVTTQAVGSNRMLHFSVGNRNFSYAIGANADLGDFAGNAGSIASGSAVKVTVQFNGTGGSITKISNASN